MPTTTVPHAVCFSQCPSHQQDLVQNTAHLLAAVVKGESRRELAYLGPTEAAAILMGVCGLAVIGILRCCWCAPSPRLPCVARLMRSAGTGTCTCALLVLLP